MSLVRLALAGAGIGTALLSAYAARQVLTPSPPATAAATPRYLVVAVATLDQLRRAQQDKTADPRLRRLVAWPQGEPGRYDHHQTFTERYDLNSFVTVDDRSGEIDSVLLGLRPIDDELHAFTLVYRQLLPDAGSLTAGTLWGFAASGLEMTLCGDAHLEAALGDLDVHALVAAHRAHYAQKQQAA